MNNMNMCRHHPSCRIGLLVAMWCASTLCMAAGSDAYPGRPVRVITPYSAGSITDVISRSTMQKLSEQLGEPFVVDNPRTIVGTEDAGKANPDGYTLLMSGSGFAVLAAINPSLPFDALKDFTAISQISGDAQVLVVPASLNVNSLKAFIALAQANPGKLNYGTGGVGTLGHLMSELFKKAANVNIVHIPYKGSGDVLNAMFGGQVQMQLTTVSTLLPFIKSGKVRALAVTTDGGRLSQLPDVPSMSEAGVQGMANYSWSGLQGPAGLPKEIVRKLQGEIVKAVRTPAMKERFANLELVGSSPEEFEARIQGDIKRFTEIVKSAGIPPE